jgi:MoxR-like ATPase
MNRNPFIQPLHGTTITLDAGKHFRQRSCHRWDVRELDALALAYAARRPLLVRGEPGSGKSQLARAAAALLGAGEPLLQVIDPRFEPRDLLYRYDTILRLADANTRVDIKDGEGGSGIVDETRYVSHGVLWEAFQEAADGKPVVVLVDEIDKGDADVPNSLLEVLGQHSFTVREVPIMEPPMLPQDAWPMVLITTNEERELPAAFIRRCVVLNLNPPPDDKEFLVWLRARVDAHEDVVKRLHSTVVDQALKQVLEDRNDAHRFGYPKAGLAEALDLLTALAEITGNQAAPEQHKEQQLLWLNRISAYALVKHAGTDPGQSRLPIAALTGADEDDNKG